MKKLKLYFVTACLVFGGIHLGFGQERQSKNERGDQKEQQVRKQGSMYEALDLTSEQEAKIKEIRKAYSVQIQKVKGDEALSEEDREKHIKEIRIKQRHEMSSVLTDEQREQMKEHFKSQNGYGENYHSEMTQEERIKSHMHRLDSIVSFTEDQKVKVQSILEDFSKKRNEIWENNNLSQEERREQMNELRLKQTAEIDNILDEKQNELLKKHQEERKVIQKESKNKPSNVNSSKAKTSDKQIKKSN